MGDIIHVLAQETVISGNRDLVLEKLDFLEQHHLQLADSNKGDLEYFFATFRTAVRNGAVGVIEEYNETNTERTLGLIVDSSFGCVINFPDSGIPFLGYQAKRYEITIDGLTYGLEPVSMIKLQRGLTECKDDSGLVYLPLEESAIVSDPELRKKFTAQVEHVVVPRDIAVESIRNRVYDLDINNEKQDLN